MNQYKSSAELKASAKEHLFGKYGVVIAALLLVSLCVFTVNLMVFGLVDTTTVFGTILYLLISFIISVLAGLFNSGVTYLYLKVICERPISVNDIFYGFKMCPDKALIIQGWISLITFVAYLPMNIISLRMNSMISSLLTGSLYDFALSFLLLYSLSMILAGVVSILLSLFYGQAFYLLHDFPQYSGRELLTMSRRLMTGNKGRLFYMQISFVPLILLGFVSCGVGLLWIFPYMQAAQTEFYLDIIKKRKPDDLR